MRRGRGLAGGAVRLVCYGAHGRPLTECTMDRWLTAALDYVPRWLELQMRASEQPGCAIAVALDGKVIFEQALGYANLERGVRLTPRHRFRIASHSKSFTAAGIM